MKVLRRWFNFYIDASIHVALAIVCLFSCTHLDLGFSPNAHLMGFVFFSSVACYNFIKQDVASRRHVVLNSYGGRLLVFSLFCFLLALYSFFELQRVLWLPIALCTVLSALYAVPFLPDSLNLRKLSNIKIYLVALVWMGFTAVLPIVDSAQHYDGFFIWLLCERFLFVLILMVPFEVRDMTQDPPELKTLPQRYGIEALKRMAYFTVLVWFIVAMGSVDFARDRILSYAMMAVILICVIYKTRKHQSRYYASFWVESIPIVWFLIKYTEHFF